MRTAAPSAADPVESRAASGGRPAGRRASAMAISAYTHGSRVGGSVARNSASRAVSTSVCASTIEKRVSAAVRAAASGGTGPAGPPAHQEPDFKRCATLEIKLRTIGESPDRALSHIARPDRGRRGMAGAPGRGGEFAYRRRMKTPPPPSTRITMTMIKSVLVSMGEPLCGFRANSSEAAPDRECPGSSAHRCAVRWLSGWRQRVVTPHSIRLPSTGLANCTAKRWSRPLARNPTA